MCVAVDDQARFPRIRPTSGWERPDDGSKLYRAAIIRLQHLGEIVNRITGISATIALSLTGAGPARAHHAFSAQYDPGDTETLTGVVVKVEWLNPHAYFFIDVADEATGAVTTWACELTSPVGLMRRGWTRNSLAIGDVVEVEGALARDGGNALNAASVVLTSTGKRLFGRSAEEEQQVGEPGR